MDKQPPGTPEKIRSDNSQVSLSPSSPASKRVVIQRSPGGSLLGASTRPKSGPAQHSVDSVEHESSHSTPSEGVKRRLNVNSDVRQCEICNAPISRPNYARHIKLHEKTRPRHACPKCDKSYKRPDHLRNHMRIHENGPERDDHKGKHNRKQMHGGKGSMEELQSREIFDCHFCAFQGTTDIAYLRNHLRKFHKADVEKKCQKCKIDQGEDNFLSDDHLRCCFQFELCDVPLPELPLYENNASTPEIENADQQAPAPRQEFVFEDDPEEAPPDHLFQALGPYGENETVKSLMDFYWSEIRQRSFTRDPTISHEFYFRMFGTDQAFDWRSALTHIYKSVHHSFNVSISPTVLLRKAANDSDQDEDEFMIFFAQDHTRSITGDQNLVIYDNATLQRAITTLDNMGSIEEKISRPGSAWTLVAVLSMAFFVHLRKPFLCGGRVRGILPSWISKNHEQIISFERDRTSRLIDDRLCIFRCICQLLGADAYDINVVRGCYAKYQARFQSAANPDEFDGVPEDLLEEVEKLYSISIQVYRKISKDEIIPLRTVCEPQRPGNPARILNVHSHLIDPDHGLCHYSYIRSLDHFLYRHTCPTCSKMFRTAQLMKRHSEQSCSHGVPSRVYPGGCYLPRQSIFEKLEQWGIRVDENRRLCKHLIVLDCEAALRGIREFKFSRRTGNTDEESVEMRLADRGILTVYHEGPVRRLQAMCKHQLITAAVASTVEDECRFYHGPEPRQIVRELFEDLLELSEMIRDKEREKFAEEIKQLHELKDRAKASIRDAADNGDTGDTGDDDEARKNSMFRERAALRKLERLCHEMDMYCSMVTVATFNGGRYDLHLLKALLFTEMVKRVRRSKKAMAGQSTEQSMQDQELLDFECAEVDSNGDGECDTEGMDDSEKYLKWPTAITRGNRILLLSTQHFRFIDICNYTSPGTSLEKFLLAYHPSGAQKGAFPYELIRDYQDLINITEFPKIEEFFSTLKGRLSQKAYSDAKRVWDCMKEKNMLSYIRWYNENDSGPFLAAALRFAELFYEITSVDIYKEAQSIPGVSMLFLFRRLAKLRPCIRFGLFEQDQSDLADSLMKSITGGLAIINRRIIDGGVTPIRKGKSIAQKVIGYDANALQVYKRLNQASCGLTDILIPFRYLWSIGQASPSGKVTHWVLKSGGRMYERKTPLPDSDLKRRRMHKEAQYLRFREFLDNTQIRMASDGSQQTLGLKQIRVDGYSSSNNTVYFFNGCFWHCHGKTHCLNTKIDFARANPTSLDTFNEQLAHLSDFGFKLDVMWECTWTGIEKASRILMNKRKLPLELIQFAAMAEHLVRYKAQCYVRPFANVMFVKQATMKQALLDGQVFGFALVTLRCRPEFMETYSEFPPIIKKAAIGIEDVGDYMAGIAKAQDKLKVPQTMLIGSYFGESIWLFSEMVAFLSKRGVDIEAVHEIAQFDKEAIPPFDWFTEEVTNNRRQGDANPELHGCVAELWKLKGNSAYGKALTNVANHMHVFYADRPKASQMANNCFHSRTIPLVVDEGMEPECYEIHSRKERHVFSNPTAIGLAVYGYAKLRMLMLMYDVLIPFLSRDKWTLCLSDTDSYYIAIAGDSLDDIVREDKRDEWFRVVKPAWFVDEADPLSKRKPGIYKKEKEADRFAGPATKIYVMANKLTGEEEAKCRGGQLSEVNAPAQTWINYVKIITGDVTANMNVHNIGIRVLPNYGLVSAIQERRGITAVTCKRIYDEHGDSEPLAK